MSWLYCRTPRPEAPYRLVCFPHAGGSAQFFGSWSDALPGIEVQSVLYPGRAQRIAEPPPVDLRGMVADIAEALRPLDDRPLVFFGHSMGAVIAYETALLLKRRGTPILRLFASGCRAPHRERPSLPDGGEFTEEAVVAAVMELGGVDAELMANKMMRELVLPYLIGDLRMFEAYEHRATDVLDCPVTAIAGDTDEHVTAAEADFWSVVTRGPFRRHQLPGGHFYLTDHPPFDLIEEALREEVPAVSKP
ncbi:thioesterase II family protein [Streptomyces sp. NPDC055721]|uniref:thioesterase II family protein n=1 Tax=Streptomyces sp. NPDC127132 TaxID=3345374 RepID=UPI0036303678